MADAAFNDDEDALLALVPEDGTAIGNISLRRSLRWSQSRYDLARDGLIEKGALGVGKGQGGSVWLVEPYIWTLLHSVPPDGSFATRGSILKQTGWSDERFVFIADLAIAHGFARSGPRNNLALILTPVVEEFLLRYAVGNNITGAFDAAGVATALRWDVNRIHQVRARILEKEHRAAKSERTSKRESRRSSPIQSRQNSDSGNVDRRDVPSAEGPHPVEVLVAYAPADSELREKLHLHISTLRQNGLIRDWSDVHILPGEEIEKAKREKLNRADVVLLLISSDFLASYGVEVKSALARHKAGEAVVVPVILRRCHWEVTELGKLKALPKDGLPIRAWSDIDEAFYSVVQGIEAIVRARSGF
jgi:hypothetical protein